MKQDLKDGQLVLFSGTPCQTSGLNAYVGKKLREKLFLLDIVCHGVSGPYLWRDYLTYLEKKQGDTIQKVNFRDKQRFGWSAHHETFEFAKSGNIAFNYLFYQSEMYRYSCGKCHFCNTIRPSDITIADFWGWEKTDADINKDDKGVSLVLVNTEKEDMFLMQFALLCMSYLRSWKIVCNLIYDTLPDFILSGWSLSGSTKQKVLCM